MPVHFDVVVNRGAHGLPMGQHIALGRESLQSWTVHLGEQTGAATFPLAEGTPIEFLQQLRDGLVQFGQGIEAAMAQGSDDPSLRHQHCIFDLRFVKSYRMQVVWGTPRPDSA